jgi:hypothetical protein
MHRLLDDAVDSPGAAEDRTAAIVDPEMAGPYLPLPRPACREVTPERESRR